MYAARDAFGHLSLFDKYPKRYEGFWIYDNPEEILFGFYIEDESIFPDLKWEDKPIEVVITEKSNLNLSAISK